MNRLYILLKSQGIKQKTIAETLHVDPSLVSKWMKGSRSPSISQYQALAKILQVPLEALLEDVDVYEKPVNMDLITLLDFKGYLHLKYSALSIIFLMGAIFIYITRLETTEITLMLSIFGLMLIGLEFKRIMKPPKTLMSHHMQSVDMSHTFTKNNGNKTHVKIGVMYHALLFFIQPAILFLVYDMNKAFDDVQSESIIVLWFLATFTFIGCVLVMYTIKKYPNKITYHASTFRFQEMSALMIKVIVIVQSFFIWMSLLLLDISYPLQDQVFALSICAFILGHLIHQHALLLGMQYKFEFKEKMDK